MSIRFEVKKLFDASQERTYRGLLDLDAAKNWMQGLVEIKRLDEGSMKIGSQWKETRKMFGKEASEHFEVIELKEYEKIVLRCDGTKGSMGKGEYIFTYKLSSSSGKTEVNLVGEINGLTGFSKWFGKLFAGSFKKACEKDMDALKSYIEK